MILAIILLVLVAAMKMRGGEGPLPPVVFEPMAADALTIDAPRELEAGEPIPVSVTGPSLDDGDEVRLLVETSYATWQEMAVAQDGIAEFAIPSPEGPAAGVFSLTALHGRSAGNATLEYLSGTGVDPLELFLGPRTIEATNKHATMIVVVAQDDLGNPVADGTQVDVTVIRPDLSSTLFEIETSGLLAWSRIISGTVSGRSKISVSVDAGRGKELDFLEIAGSPMPFLVESIDPPVPADGRSLVRLRTTELADEYGNVLPDGVDVFADVTGPGGTRRLRAQVIAGRAEFTLEAPGRPGTEAIVVTASGTLSPPLLVPFGPMVTGFDLSATTDIDGVRIAVGPVISTLGSYIPDGTPVVITSEHGERSYPTFDGVAEITVPATSEPLVVEVLGFERTVQVAS